MAKNKISEWSSTPANNTDIGGIDIAEGCAPSGINNAIRELMAQVKDMQTGADGDSLTISGTLVASGTLDVTGGFLLDGSAGTSGQVLVSAGSGNTPTWGTGIPSGVIVMWSGSIASIPSGWYLCNGSNGTPDLRNRFVVGAGSTYSVGGTGGSADAIVVAHTHTGTTSTQGDHVHNYATRGVSANQNTPPLGFTRTGAPLDTAVDTSAAGAHNHSFTTNSTGASGTNANLPPYYALAYIQKA